MANENNNPHVHLSWVDRMGNPRDVELSGSSGFVTYWMKQLTYSAFDPFPEHEVSESSEVE